MFFLPTHFLQSERKEELFDSAQKLAIADARRQLASHEESVGGASEKLVCFTSSFCIIL